MEKQNKNKIQHWQLKQRQSLPLEVKIKMSKQRIINWYEKNNGNVYVSFSGGKDSTVLLHLVRSIFEHYKNIPAVFCDTGLEYPEVKKHVKTIENVICIKPKMSFKEVLSKYGIPVISKEQSQFIYEYKNTKSDYMKKLRIEGNKSGGGKISKKWYFLLNENIKISNKCCEVMKKDHLQSLKKIHV